MKKIVAFVLAGILLVSMAGCRPSSKLASLTEKSATETAAEETNEEIDTDDVADQADDNGTFDIRNLFVSLNDDIDRTALNIAIGSE